jgi:hypothetical protein
MIVLCIKRLLCNEKVMVINRLCTTAIVWSPTVHTRDEHGKTNVFEIGRITVILKNQDFSVHTIGLRATSWYLHSSMSKDRIFLTVKYSSPLNAKIFKEISSTPVCTLYKWSWVQFRTILKTRYIFLFHPCKFRAMGLKRIAYHRPFHKP